MTRISKSSDRVIRIPEMMEITLGRPVTEEDVHVMLIALRLWAYDQVGDTDSPYLSFSFLALGRAIDEICDIIYTPRSSLGVDSR